MNSPVYPPIQAVRRCVSAALDEDLLPMGDITAALLPEGTIGSATFVSRADGVFAGALCISETCAQIDPDLHVTITCDDGAPVTAGTELARVTGSFASIVTMERTALNFACHLSGIATLTRCYVALVAEQNPACRVLDTRKTTPGLRALEKAAVRAGGGTNHRGSLSEGVLVKDNHLGHSTIGDAVRRARALWPGRMIEVECDRVEQVEEALLEGATLVLCDNMSIAELSRSVSLVRKHRDRAGSSVLLEASGGVNLETAAAIAATGVDLISIGALTHSAPILDIGLDLDGASGKP